MREWVEQRLLPSVHDALPAVFPEFGWVCTRHGWRATNEEFTHSRFAARAERLVCTDSRGFLIHGGESFHWFAYANGGEFPIGERWHEVVRELAVKVGLEVPTRAPRQQDESLFARYLGEIVALSQGDLEQALPFLASRGVDRETAETWGFGFISSKKELIGRLAAGHGIFQEGLLTERPRDDGTSIWDRRVVCPWRDSRGRVVALWGRRIDVVVDDAPKYLVTGRRPLLFGHDRALPRARRDGLVLVEGFFDAVVLQAHGQTNAAARGGSSFTDDLLVALSSAGVRRCTVVLDPDEGGRSGLEQLVRVMRACEGDVVVDIVDPVHLNGDPDELVRAGQWPTVLTMARPWLTWWCEQLLVGVTPSSSDATRIAAARACAGWGSALVGRLPLEVGEVARMVEAATGIRAEYALLSMGLSDEST